MPYDPEEKDDELPPQPEDSAVNEDDLLDDAAGDAEGSDESSPGIDLPPQGMQDSELAALSAAPLLPDPEKIAAIRDQRDKDIALATLAQGFTQAGAGLAGQKADPHVFDAARAIAQNKANEAQSDSKLRQKAVGDFIKQKQAEKKIEQGAQKIDQKEESLAQGETRLDQAAKRMQNDVDYKKEWLAAYKTAHPNPADMRQMTRDEIAHRMNVRSLKAKPELRQRLTQYQNLDNALNNFLKADHTNPQSFDELQQAARSNLGIKGTSGITEREHAYINTLGLEGSRLLQFATGKMSDVAKDGDAAKHIINLVSLEKQNIRRQYDKVLQAAIGGHASIYKRRPDLKADIDDLIQLNESQLDPVDGAAPVQPGTKPAGHAPGSIVRVKGKQYRVGSDGDSLEPMK